MRRSPRRGRGPPRGGGGGGPRRAGGGAAGGAARRARGGAGGGGGGAVGPAERVPGRRGAGRPASERLDGELDAGRGGGLQGGDDALARLLERGVVAVAQVDLGGGLRGDGVDRRAAEDD